MIMAKEVTQETIGQLLHGEHERDAIHIAVLPVICADNWLTPGASIGLVFGSTNEVTYRQHGTHQGVVDPYLFSPIRKGDKFWMFVNPNVITGLRHEWIHPAIDNQPVVENDSETWLRTFASKWNFDYDEMIASASSDAGEDSYNYIVARGIDLHSEDELKEDRDKFWHHLEILTGKTFSNNHKKEFIWSCSC
jgi:hypothetical protein